MRFESHEDIRYGLKYGDLIVCEGGEPGRCAIWKDQIPDMRIQKALHRIRPLKRLNNVYLHYWFLLAGKTRALEPYFTGTTIKHLTGRSIAELELPLPPLHVQQAIAHILGALDNKIELNRQMNSTLEAMAQALFKSWFVDFDPVIDNALAAANPMPDVLTDRAERRKQLHARSDTGSSTRLSSGQPLPSAIQQRFPNQFVFTETMDWVPEEWGAKLLAEFGSIVCGKTPAKSRSDYFGEDIPFIKIPDMHTAMFVVNPTEKLSKLGAAAQPRKTIPRGGICASCIATVGKVVIATTNSQTNQQINSVVPRETYLTPNLYFYMLNLERHFHDLASGGSATLNMNTSTFSKVAVLKPDETILQIFGREIQPHFDKIESNQRENMALSSLRDTLLPKLLSGQLRIPEAEQQVAEVI